MCQEIIKNKSFGWLKKMGKIMKNKSEKMKKNGKYSEEGWQQRVEPGHGRGRHEDLTIPPWSY